MGNFRRSGGLKGWIEEKGDRTMNKLTARMTFVILAACGLASMAAAQSKLGTVDSRVIFEKSAEGKRVLARLQDLDRKNADAIGKLDQEITALQSRLSTQRLTLTEEASLQLSSDIERKSTERKRKAEDAAASLTELRDRLFRTVQTELLAIIGQMGKELGYDLILDLGPGNVLYANPAVDLSAEVIKRYDASKSVPAKK